jgi:hypothetical protein
MIDSGEQVAYLLCAGGVGLPVAGVAARMLWQRSSRKQAANLQRAVAQIAAGLRGEFD